jgi:hypothetical protein
MDDERYDAMRHAVDLARTGKFNNWWTIAARLRLSAAATDLEWTPLSVRGLIDCARMPGRDVKRHRRPLDRPTEHGRLTSLSAATLLMGALRYGAIVATPRWCSR